MDNLIELVSNLVRDHGVEIIASIMTYTAAMRRFNTFFQLTGDHYINSPGLINVFTEIRRMTVPNISSVNATDHLNNLTKIINSLNDIQRQLLVLHL
jgi:hypothetical protein